MMQYKTQNITFIGLGKMGTALAQRLLQANVNLTVYNRTASKIQPLVQAGAKSATSMQEAAKDADVIFTCLLDDNAVLQTVEGEQGFLQFMRPGAIHIGTSTILPATSKTLSQLHQTHGSVYICNTVLGVPTVAEQGQLTSLVAGNPQAIAACEALIQSYSAKILQVGEQPYLANALKICINYMLAASIAAMGEVYTFAEKIGLNNDMVSGVLDSIFLHPAFKLYVQKIKNRDFDQVNFDLTAGLKDLNLFQQAFANENVVADIGSLVKNKLIAACALGLGEKDWSALTEVTRLNAGLK